MVSVMPSSARLDNYLTKMLLLSQRTDALQYLTQLTSYSRHQAVSVTVSVVL